MQTSEPYGFFLPYSSVNNYTFYSYGLRRSHFMPILFVIRYKSYAICRFRLIRLPFFLIGDNSSFLYNGNWHKNTFIIVILSIILLASTIILSKFNGFVSIAICDYGNNLFLYYINAIIGIAASIGICLLLRHYFIRRSSLSTTNRVKRASSNK